MKSFIITVDTEGDNLWGWKDGQAIKTKNAYFIERFQSLCEKYAFKPIYLVNYEMALDNELHRVLYQKNINNECEIGMHLHAWNSPPNYRLENIYGGNPYVTEYPKEICYDKHVTLKKLLEDRFDCQVVSYRAGRWSTNKLVYNILDEIGILIDCSVTPGINHACNDGCSVSGGSDYRRCKNIPYMLTETLMEVPVTTTRRHTASGRGIKSRVKNLIIGKEHWLRPATDSVDDMKILIDNTLVSSDYCEFMIHSSELMPGGSPYFQTKADIEQMYTNIESVFSYASGFTKGETLRNYYHRRIKDYK